MSSMYFMGPPMVSMSSNARPSSGGLAEHALFLLEQGPERRPGEDARQVARERRPPPLVHPEARVAGVHEVGGDGDVADREARAGEEVAADLALEVVEEGRHPRLDGGLDDRLVGRPAEEPWRDDPLDEDRARQRLREGRVAVLLEPQGPGVQVGIGGVERWLRMRALEIGADDRRSEEHT